jgi:hypothetical protein
LPAERRRRARETYIKGLVEHVDDVGLADDRPILVRQVLDQQAEEEVGRLLLGKLGAVLLHVAVLRSLGDGVAVHGKLALGSCGVARRAR